MDFSSIEQSEMSQQFGTPMSPQVSTEPLEIEQHLLTNRAKEVLQQARSIDRTIPIHDGSWGVDTVKFSYPVDVSDCDSSSSLWSTTSTQFLSDMQFENTRSTGTTVFNGPGGQVSVRVDLYSVRSICHVELNAARCFSSDKEYLASPEQVQDVIAAVISGLSHAVTPAFSHVTSDGEIVWDDDWMDQVRFRRIDLARNFQVDQPEVLIDTLPAVRGRYQRRSVVHSSQGGGWMIESPTSSSGRDKLYNKSAEMAQRPEDVERVRAMEKTLVRFETQLMRARLKDMGITTLAALTAFNAWKALLKRWDASGWGGPLPEVGSVMEAIAHLTPKQQMHLLGYLTSRSMGATIPLSPAQIRLQERRAKDCGLTPGLPVDDLGTPTTYLDIEGGRVAPLDGHMPDSGQTA